MIITLYIYILGIKNRLKSICKIQEKRIAKYKKETIHHKTKIHPDYAYAIKWLEDKDIYEENLMLELQALKKVWQFCL